MGVWEQNWVPNHQREAGEQRRERQEEGQAEEEGGEVVVGHRLRALEEVEEEKQRTSRVEREERVGRGRRHQSWKVAEEVGGLQSQGEAEAFPCQRVGEVEEVQGEATGGDERWVGVRTWGEQGEGGLDSAH